MEITPELLTLILKPYEARIKELEEENAKLKGSSIEPDHSEQCNELFAALSKAQAAYTVAYPNRTTNYWGTNYEDLDTIIQAARPALEKHGLAFLQQIVTMPDNTRIIKSKLTHSSGQWIGSRDRFIPTKDDPLTYGSTLNYHKRHSAASLLGITIKEDTLDDNAEIARADTQKIFAKGTALNRAYDPRQESYERITKEQLEELEYEIGDHLDLVEELYKNYKVESLADLPKSRYREARNNLMRIKLARQKK